MYTYFCTGISISVSASPPPFWWVHLCILTNWKVLSLFKLVLLLLQLLVGGWTNPSEKYARQIGSCPQGWNIPKIFELPPPRELVVFFSQSLDTNSLRVAAPCQAPLPINALQVPGSKHQRNRWAERSHKARRPARNSHTFLGEIPSTSRWVQMFCFCSSLWKWSSLTNIFQMEICWGNRFKTTLWVEI